MSNLTIILPQVEKHNQHTLQQFHQQLCGIHCFATLVIGIDHQQSPCLVHIPGANPAEIASLLEKVAYELRAQTKVIPIIQA